MRKILFIIIVPILLFSQNRSTLFSTGNPPNLGEGWDIRCTEFSSNNIGDINLDQSVDILDVVTIVGFILGNLELTEEQQANADTNYDSSIDILDVIIVINIILNGSEDVECISGLSGAVKFISPNEYTFEAFSVIFQTADLEGDGLFEIRLHLDNIDTPGEILGSWNLALNENIAMEYYVFTGDTDCIMLQSMTYYWLSVHPANNVDEALWLYSADDYPHSFSNDLGNSWSSTLTDPVGCTKIFGEQIYDSPELEPSNEVVYDWALEDLNENSEYFSQNIGPSTFIEQDFVSVYYFGKAG